MQWFNKHNDAENIDEKGIETLSDTILTELEEAYRFKEINDLKLSPNGLKTELTDAAVKLYNKTVNVSNPVYKKIQHLEASYSAYKSELDNKIYYELKNLEDRCDESEEDLHEKRREVKELNRQKKYIAEKFNKIDDKTVHGNLSKISGWWFFIIMLVVGVVELLIYQKVFLSQEIGLKADMNAEEQHMVFWTSGAMAVGFTTMIIWMAHSLGSIIRHFANTTRSEKWTNSIYIFIIVSITAGAIWATVDIRGKMHEILAYDEKVSLIKDAQDRKADAIFDDDEDEEDSFSNEDDEEDEDSDFGDEDEDTEEDASNTQESSVETKKSPEALMESYREIAMKMKESTANVFMIINFFIFIAGVFLSYFSHTSSPAYDHVLLNLKKARNEEKKLEKVLKKLDDKIIRFKKRVIGPLFRKLLTEAAKYDLQARIYNTYMETFQMRLLIIEEHIKDLYTLSDACYNDINSEDLIKKYISIGKRKELHNVHTNLEEYMIYNYTQPSTKGEENEKGKENV